MNHKRALKVLSVLFLILLAGLKSAEACSCGGAANILDSFESAKNVVLIKAVEVEKVGKDSKYAVDGVKSTKMVVEKVYKGNLKAGDEMIFAQGGGADCIWTFNEKSIGRQYLFYLGETFKNNLWVGFGCGRSNSVEGAADDLLYLEKMDKMRGKTRISGTINFENYDSMTTEPTIEGIKIKITGGGKTYNLKTDKNGVYEIYDLPPGKYQIIPEKPKGWKINEFYLRYQGDLITNRKDDDDDTPLKEYAVQLAAKKHATVDFHLEIDNAVRGQIYSPDGKLMKGVCVRLYPPTGITKDFTYLADCTEADGRFEIDEIPPGSYILVANDENEITSSEPFRTLYYPGVFELEKAAIINISEGIFLEDFNIHVPQIEELITVEGFFLYSDGKPVIGETVQFFSDKSKDKFAYDAGAKTDAKGRFSLKILKGMKGRVFGAMYTYTGEFEKCPKLDALIRQKGKNGSYEAKTQEITVSGEENLFGVELKFPFPGCNKFPRSKLTRF
jgi:hypothetical protein